MVLADIDVASGLKVAKSILDEFGAGRAMFIKCDVTCETDMKSLALLLNIFKCIGLSVHEVKSLS